MAFRIGVLVILGIVLIMGSMGAARAQSGGSQLAASSFAASGQTTLMSLSQIGTGAVSRSSGSSVPTDIKTELSPDRGGEAELPNAHAHTPSNTAQSVPNPSPTAITTKNDNLVAGFNGLTHRDQRNAGTGVYVNTQFSLEPPDQGLCVGNGFVVETVNTAMRVRSMSGGFLTAATALNQFFGLTPEINRSTLTFGDFTSDPKCYFDQPTHRFFLTLLQIDVVATSGAFGVKSHVLLAVTQTGDPTGTWNLFSLDVTNDGTLGTPSHPGCSCFGDQPLIGADANGFYISTNEFSLHPFGAFFNGAQVYAMSKTKLAAGIAPPVVLFNTGAIPTPDVGGIWYSVQPATTPPGGSYASGNRGTEFFLSALQFFGNQPLDNRIAVWALTNTRSLNSASPNLAISVATIRSETYGQPPNAQQKDGPRPLNAFLVSLGFPSEPLALLAGNDDRMNQVVYADGLLWAGVNTVFQSSNPNRVAIAWFVVSPWVSENGRVHGSVVNQGYIAPSGASALFPSIGVNANGEGVIAFTLVGPNYFPSAAYVSISQDGTGKVHIAMAGAAPEDGFTGYAAEGFPGNVARWGDYSAASAVAGEDGKIWFATEYIPNLPRTLIANWGTFIGAVETGD